MAEARDVDTLKRRGRRRLVGAVALVLLAVIVLPMVFDPEPRDTAPPVSVRIPGENETAFTPKLKPVPAKKQASEKEFVVQVGVFANADSVVAKLAAAKIPYYTEAVKGNLIRVRAGPFATKDAAEKALEQLKALGLQPGGVTARSG
jgi:DedD protein